MRILNILTVDTPPTEDLFTAIENLQRAIHSHDFTYLLPLEPELSKEISHERLRQRLAIFEALHKRLALSDCHCGILLQTTLGHAERKQHRESLRFQPITAANPPHCEVAFCPLDPSYQTWITESIQSIAQVNPDYLLLDDDFRLQHHPPVTSACFCERHLARIRQATNQDWSASTLMHALLTETGHENALREKWQTVLNESMLEISVLVRDAADSIAPGLPIGTCLSGNAMDRRDAARRSALLAGNDRPLIRVAGGIYGRTLPTHLPERWDSMAAQRNALPLGSEVIVEADSFPHNLFSLPASLLELHLRCSLLLGFEGAKVWCKPTASWAAAENTPYEEVYHRIASQAAPLMTLARQIEWLGPTAPIKDSPAVRDFLRPHDGLKRSAWVNLLGTLALPHQPGNGRSPTKAICGEDARAFSREEWLEMLSGGLLLDGIAAEIVANLGLQDLLGVRVGNAESLRLDEEHFTPVPSLNSSAAGQRQWLAVSKNEDLRQLVPLHKEVEVISHYCIRTASLNHHEATAPAVVLYENALGGRVAIFAASVEQTALIHYRTPRRREQLRAVLRWLLKDNAPPVEVANVYQDLYFLQGRAGDDLYLFLANLHSDTLPHIMLEGLPPSACALEIFTDAGWQPLPGVHSEGTGHKLPLPLPSLQSVILKVPSAF